MARALKKLNARQVATLNREGRHSDGGGLYLVVGPGASRRWAFLFRWRGKLKEMGLGSLASVSLADAREKASEARRTVASGLNPIEERRAQEAVQDATTTFGAFADDLMKDLAHGFRNEKHRTQWAMTLTTLCRTASFDETRRHRHRRRTRRSETLVADESRDGFAPSRSHRARA